jgi:hypothetical protein
MLATRMPALPRGGRLHLCLSSIDAMGRLSRNLEPEEQGRLGMTQPRGVSGVDARLPERLERGEVIVYPQCPFPLPEGSLRSFLLEHGHMGRFHKNISYDPGTERATGFSHRNRRVREQLSDLLGDFSRVATGWLEGVLPGYAEGWKVDRVSYRPLEEATRKLRPHARNDLLHIDAFPTRPSNGYRILRLFVNLNPSEPRVWITSETFATVLERFGAEAGWPGTPTSWWQRCKRELLALVRPARRGSDYDEFMVRFHHFLKAHDEFQERSPKRYYHFPPNSAWLVMSDAATHAVLRGQYALDHSYFVAPATLALPAEAPAALLERACGKTVLRHAA